MDIKIKFGEKIRILRNERNLSQESLGFKAKLHRTYIGNVERGEKNLTLENIEKLSKALNITLNELFNDL
ncbi:MAG: helix-turn-helix transcriptional regulator [Candidatus Gracilibacteria bacterium]|nr:helix-turn-helix transcriptional regulator [Candidatus Gracilibacteria bacterium]MDD4531059.1 helix-turn-helix transcriptional regulator [Candidatus Gracilibacteria bacterium]